MSNLPLRRLWRPVARPLDRLRPSLRSALPEIFKFAVGLIAFAIALEGLAAVSGLPDIAKISKGVESLWSSGVLVHDVEVSCARWLLGWTLGASIGVVLGLLTGRSGVARTGLEGFMILCRAIPFVSLVPLMVRLFGLEEPGKVLLVAWASTTISWIIVHQTALTLPEPLVWRGISLGISGWSWIVRVLIPACAAGIYSSLRTSLSLGLIVIAVAEMSGVYERSTARWWSEGIGYRLFRSLDQSRDDLLMAAILIFAVTGIIVDRVFVMFWRVAAMTLEMTRKSRVRKLAEEAKMLKGDFDGWPPSTDVIVEGLTAGYDGTTVLHDLSLRIPASTTLVVIGPNGCGKTTLIRALGLFKSASFRVQKRAVAGSIPDKPGQWAGIVLQDSPVFGHLTVWGNVAVCAHLRRVPRAERNSLTYSALDRFGLVDLASRQADTLSGGQRQRLALASAVTNRPRVLLLDEPFAALDWFSRRELQEYYREAVAGNVTAIFVTHDLHEALCVGDYIRVGLDPDAVTFRIERRGLSVREWERAPEFAETRERIVAALEDVYGSTRINDSLPERGRKSTASRT